MLLVLYSLSAIHSTNDSGKFEKAKTKSWKVFRKTEIGKILKAKLWTNISPNIIGFSGKFQEILEK